MSNLTEKCVAQYKLDQNEASTLVVDSRDNYNAVASRNTSNLFDAAGKIGGCFNFSGSDYVLVPGEINQVFKSSFSVSFWLNAPDGQPSPATFCGSDDGPNSFLFWPEGQQLWVAYETAGTSLYIYANALEYSTWQMITVTIEQINPTTVEGRLYVNGQLATNPVTHSIVMSNWSSEIPFGIGVENFVELHPAIGKIDNFCVFDTVLTVKEIAFLYNGGEGTEDFAEYGMIGPPVVTDITTDNDSLAVSLTGEAGATHTVLYRLSTATAWINGGTRTGDGNVVIDSLAAGTYYVQAYSTLDGVNSTPGNMVTSTILDNPTQGDDFVSETGITVTVDNDNLVVNITGQSGASHRVLYKTSTESVWKEGGVRKGDGQVTITSLPAATYHVQVKSVYIT